MMHPSSRCHALLAMLTAHTLAGLAHAQSFNIDLDRTGTGNGAGAPVSAFAGVGIAGVWNSILSGTSTPVALNRVDGVATGVTFSRSTANTMSSFDNASTTGDVGLLMDDYQRLDTVPLTVTIGNLAAGHYRVITYANRVNGSGNRSAVSVANSPSPSPQLVGGAISPADTFTRGVTHAEHVVVLASTGSITITLDNSPPSGTGGLNGVQLVQSLPMRLYVDASKPAGGDGLTWGTALDDLQPALALAASLNTVTEVWVADGTYKPAPPGGARSATFAPTKRLYGGFAGTETTLTQRNIAANPTVLCGDLNSDDTANFGNRADNVFHVVSAGAAQSGGRVDGFVIRGGYADGAAATDQRGGGINVTDAIQFRVDNCTLTDNHAKDDGAAVYFLPASTSPPRQLIVSRCLIERNRATDGGAALRMNGAAGITTHLVNCRILSNSNGFDGTVHVFGGTCHLANCLVAFNSASNAPGIEFRGNVSGSSVRNCTVTQNFGPTPASAPGVVFNSASGAVTIANSVITRQWAMNVPNQPTDIVTFGNPVPTLQIIRSSHNSGGPFGDDGLYGIRFDDPIGPDLVPGTGDELFSLSPASALVDQGSNADAPPDTADLDADGNTAEFIPFDLAGNLRFQNVAGSPDFSGPGPSIDQGAYERAGSLQEWAAVPGGVWTNVNSWFPTGVPSTNTTALLRFIGSDSDSVVVSSPATAGRLMFDGNSDHWDIRLDANLTLGPTAGPAVHFIGGSDSVYVNGSGVLLAPGRHVRIGDSTVGVVGVGPSVFFVGAGDALNCQTISVDGAGELSLWQGPTVRAPGGVLVNNRCSLGGDGAILGNVRCLGELRPGAGLFIDGDLTFGTAWMPWATEPSLGFSLGDPDGVGSLDVSGTVTLAGTLQIDRGFPESPIPPVGTEWTLLSMGSRSDTFRAAFVPGDATKLTRLIYQDAARSSVLIAQVDDRDNVQSLNPPRGFVVSGNPAAAAVGKIRNDALPVRDLAVVVPDTVSPTTADGTLRVLFNQETTSTTWNGYAAVVLTAATQRNPSAVCIADFNADGFNDIAVANRNGIGGATGTVSVFRNNGAGSLITPATIITTQIGAEPSAIAAGDLDGDGKPDLAVANAADNTLSLLRNTSPVGGVPSFVALVTPPIPVGTNPVAVFIADIDHDGDNDIGTANRGSDNCSVLYNDGVVLRRESSERAWAGLQPVRSFLCADEPSSIQPGNIDNGKDDELVVANTGSGSISVLIRGPDGQYAASSGPIGPAPTSVALIDIDNDPADRLDIVAVTQDAGTSQIAVLQTELGPNGELLLTGSPDITPPDPPTLVLADDVNGDGTTDLIAVNPDTVALRDPSTSEIIGTRGGLETVKIQLNYRPCPADLNYDRLVNSADLTFFLGRFGQTATPGSLAERADFNDDGIVNTRDLTFFLNRFARPCP